MGEHIKVFCRLRSFIPEDEIQPESHSAFLTPEDEHDSGCFSSFNVDSGECVYQRSADNGTDGKRFRFDGLLGKDACQRSVYESVGENIVKGCLDGFNGAILTYGQTGSGKTYSMRGEGNHDEKKGGVIERVFQQLLKAKSMSGREDMTLSLSCVQVYCELLQDLLEPNNGNLTIKEISHGGGKDGTGSKVYVHGLTRIPINSIDQASKILQLSDLNRNQCSTKLNAHSSRSHACYIIHIERKLQKDEGARVLSSTLTMVDLAGSERVKKSGVKYQALEESKAINLSLSALGNCVAALAAGRSHVPYRDSKLTRLLSESLGGNARTAILVTLAPGDDPDGENLSSLQFAVRAGRCPVVAVRNELVDYAALYSAAQAALDARNDDKNLVEVKCSDLSNQVAVLQRTIETLREEKLQAEINSQNIEKRFEDSMKAMKQDDHTAAIEALDRKWKLELDTVNDDHTKKVSELKVRWEAQLEAYKHSAALANSEWGSIEGDLLQERKGFLESMVKHRELREAHELLERQTSERIAELLNELKVKDEKESELVAGLESARYSADMSLNKASELAQRVETLEQSYKRQSDHIQNDYVSRDQVRLKHDV
mmetsp:Transcript_1671/g.2116  ORF Transcript_1671/g.2116 Transcript_1671/m.2116 type:complete len:601 (+) Transcript_1671:104-1906(+)